jgi:hypothetical protein
MGGEEQGMTDIIWEDPPPAGRRGPKSKAELFVAELEKNPGKWARYGEFKGGTSLARYRKLYPHIEWTSRRIDGLTVIFASFTGGNA